MSQSVILLLCISNILIYKIGIVIIGYPTSQQFRKGNALYIIKGYTNIDCYELWLYRFAHHQKQQSDFEDF